MVRIVPIIRRTELNIKQNMSFFSYVFLSVLRFKALAFIISIKLFLQTFCFATKTTDDIVLIQAGIEIHEIESDFPEERERQSCPHDCRWSKDLHTDSYKGFTENTHER
jgi:hypothetical protein